MGLANLVPGISGGTMLLASGIYPPFIESVADLTSLKFNRRGARVLGTVGLSAAIAILLLAGLVKGWVIDHRWVMYSLFLGLTLGGVPVLRREMRRVSGSTWVGGVVGLGLMVFLAWLQWTGETSPSHVARSWMFVAGVVGAGAMVLPGLSGGYLLLVLGVYVPVLSGIEEFKQGLFQGQGELVQAAVLDVGLPVGLGVIVGVALVSRGMRWMLVRHTDATHGVLMGMLLGAVGGLWPFQEGVVPEAGTLFKGQILTPEAVASLGPEEWPTLWFQPDLVQVGFALGWMALGLLVTLVVSRVGNVKPTTNAS